MTKHVDTAFERHFSEPPVVTVKADRTHCEACQEPLDPSVMHKCEGNKEYQAPVISSTEITERCPRCKGEGVLFERKDAMPVTYTVVCRECRVFLGAEASKSLVIRLWNELSPHRGSEGIFPIWQAGLPGDDERANVIPSEGKPSHPELSGYKGACPKCSGSGIYTAELPCDLCGGTGVIE